MPIKDSSLCRRGGCRAPRALIRWPNGRKRALLCARHYQEEQQLRLRAKYDRIPKIQRTRFINPAGYVVVRVGKMWILEHRLVMSEILNRPLTRRENVHHINGVRDDNRPENLEVWIGTTHPYGIRSNDLRCPHCGKSYTET